MKTLKIKSIILQNSEGNYKKLINMEAMGTICLEEDLQRKQRETKYRWTEIWEKLKEINIKGNRKF